MTTETQITAWLATQQDAMVALLREMVDIDSGSYNKPGIDAVGAVVRRFMAAHDIPVERCAAEARRLPARCGALGRAAGQRRRQHRADGPSRHCLPRRRGRAPAVHHPRRRRLRPGRGRHEGRAGDELLRACRLREIRRRRRRRCSALFTGDEEIGSPEGRAVIEAEARRARVVFNSRAGPRVRQRGDRAQGRRVLGFPDHRQGGAFRRQLHRRHQRDRGTRAQDPGDPRADRPRARHHAECRPGQRRAERQHRRALGGGPDRPALCRARRTATTCNGAHRRHHRAQLRAGDEGGTDHPWRVPAVDADADGETAVRDLRAAPPRIPASRPTASSPAAAPISGFTAGVGAPTICAVGPVGGKAHSPDEFLRIDSLVPRAQACARAILRLEQAGL